MQCVLGQILWIPLNPNRPVLNLMRADRGAEERVQMGVKQTFIGSIKMIYK